MFLDFRLNVKDDKYVTFSSGLRLSKELLRSEEPPRGIRGLCDDEEKTVEAKVANTVVSRYLEGKTCRERDIIKASGVPASTFRTYISERYRGFGSFLDSILPGRTKIVVCAHCKKLVQVKTKNTRFDYCNECKRKASRRVIKLRIDSKQSITFSTIVNDPKLRWIVTQCQIIWNKSYRDFVLDEFGISLPSTLSRVKDNSVKRHKRRGPKLQSLRSLEERNKLVRENKNLVNYFVKKFSKVRTLSGITWEDMVQEGMFGLMRAAELYNPDKGFRFATYAGWWIRQTLQRAWLAKNFLVTLPARYDIVGDPDNIGLFGYLEELSPSLDGFSDKSGDIESRVSEADKSELLEPGFDMVECIEFLASRELKLPDREADIFFMHVIEGATLDKVGKKYKISRERVRQICEKVKTKLRTVCNSEGAPFGD